MPMVHFIGEIKICKIAGNELFFQKSISLTWAIVAGNNHWVLKNGINFGETHTAVVSVENGVALLSHPIDVQFECSGLDGWPLFICEAWDRSLDPVRCFSGCGSVWLPSLPSGAQCLDVELWKPCQKGFLFPGVDNLLPVAPDLRSIRELSISPYLRSQIQAEAVGCVRLQVNTVVIGMVEKGIRL
eukprot:gene22425-30678_t